VATNGNLDNFRSTELISPRRFARRVGMGYALALRLVRSGDIPTLQCGTRRRINSVWISR
jgi:hypothetical protein